MSRLADAARAYIGTRFKHRGRDKRGIDCAGLGVAAFRDCGVELTDYLLYGREPHRDGLTERMTATLGEPVHVAPVRMSDLRDGDVIVMRYEIEPHHVAIVGERDYAGQRVLTMIHADGWGPQVPGARRAGSVHEHRLHPSYVEQITHVYRRPV